MPTDERLIIERHEHLAIVRFNRPHCCNALDHDTLAEIERCALDFRDDAETLSAWGLLEAVVPVEELMQRTLEFAQTYVDKSPVAAQMIKRSVNNITGALDRALMHMDADQNLMAYSTRDRAAAVEAYLGGHRPRFSGD